MTVDEVKALLSEIGSAAKKSLGQNFLISSRAIDEILKKVEFHQPQRLIEVGPGLGALTRHLKEFGYPLRLIELDKDFAEYWRQQGLDVTEDDALKVNWRELTGDMPTVLVSNLPYQISSSLLVDRCLEPAGIHAMVLMFQKEVAQRIRAKANSSDYGLLSVMAQSYWETQMLIEVSPKEFYPPPKIASRVVSFTAKSGPQPASDFLQMVKASFSQRRKLLVSNLERWQPKKSKAHWTQTLENLEIKPMARAEQLTVEQFQLLFAQEKGK